MEIFLLETGQQCNVVVLSQGEGIVGIDVKALVLGVGVGAGVFAVNGNAQFGAAALDGGHAVHHVDVGGDGGRLVIVYAHPEIVVQVDEPVLDGLDLDAGGDVQAAALALGVSAALQIGNHGEFHIVAIGIHVVLGGEFAGQGVEEAVSDTAVAEGAVGDAVHELGAEVDLEPVGHLCLGVCVHIEAFVAHVGEFQDTGFIIDAAAHEVLDFLGAAPDGEVVILLESPVFVVELEVVGVAQASFRVFKGRRVGAWIVPDFGPGIHAGVAVDEPLQVGDFLVRVFAGGVGVGCAVIPEFGEIYRAGHLGEFGRCVPAEVAGVADGGFPVGTALGGNQNHAIGGAGAVDGGRCGILHHGDALDVVGVHILQAHFNAVHQDVGGPGTAQVAAAAEGDGGLGTGRAGSRVGDGEAGDKALEGLRGVHYRTLGELLALYLGNGAGEVDFLLDTVAHDDGFFQHLAVLVQNHVQHPSHPTHLLGGVADAGEYQGGPGAHARKGIATVQVRDGPVGGPLRKHGGAHNRLAGRVGDLSAHGLVLCKHNGGGCYEG